MTLSQNLVIPSEIYMSSPGPVGFSSVTLLSSSQLVTQDPHADDYYIQVFASNLRSHMGMNPNDEHIVKFGGVGMGLVQKGSGRRANALQKMEAQVEHIVQNARLREKEKACEP